MKKASVPGLSGDPVVVRTGRVVYVEDQTAQFQCDDYYDPERKSIWEPFNCSIKFGSWASNTHKLDLCLDSSELDMALFDFKASTLKVHIEENVKYYKVSLVAKNF